MSIILSDSKNDVFIFKWFFDFSRSSSLIDEIIALFLLLVSNDNIRKYYKNREKRNKYRRWSLELRYYNQIL